MSHNIAGAFSRSVGPYQSARSLHCTSSYTSWYTSLKAGYIIASKGIKHNMFKQTYSSCIPLQAVPHVYQGHRSQADPSLGTASPLHKDSLPQLVRAIARITFEDTTENCCMVNFYYTQVTRKIVHPMLCNVMF